MSDVEEVIEEIPDTVTPAFELSEQQAEAMNRITAWYDGPINPDKREFRLGGFAGTGKTTLIKYILQHYPHPYRVAIAAFTGKAVAVLRRKGVQNAQTLHSLLYESQWSASRKKFVHSPKQTLYATQLIVVDEASMVSTELYMDLRRHNIRLLFIGDPGQLEPVGEGNPNLMQFEKCDYVLDEIHRQARSSPILRLATAIRNGTYSWNRGQWGGLTIMDRADALDNYAGEVIVCGKNATRHNKNLLRRGQLGIDPTATITVGEPVICLQNDRERGLFNGMLLTVQNIHEIGRQELRPCAWVDLTDDIGQEFYEVPMALDCFGTEKIKGARYKSTSPFDYGYALTAHKSQGSEWQSGIVLDEPIYGCDPRRWRYTAVTRFSEKLVYLL
jgi:exodeoxyribonuclease-5